MRRTPCTAALIVMVVLILTAGCATPRGNTLSDRTPEAHPAPAPLPVSGTEPFDLAQDDPLDWEDDWAWNDDDGMADFYMVADPLEKFNRVMFVFNDKLYFWVLKPVAQGYRFVIPRPVRSGIRNFFHNLGAPIRIANNVLQGQGRTAEAEVARFLYNSTVGVLGFGNPARSVDGLNPVATDLGLTLGSYGIGNGFYLVWPVLGPSTLRDSVGRVGDRWLSPLNYVDPIEASLAFSALEIVNTTSFRIGDYEALKSAALDPYQSVRDAYIQLRRTRLSR